jgi:hypothetical protein
MLAAHPAQPMNGRSLGNETPRLRPSSRGIVSPHTAMRMC